MQTFVFQLNNRTWYEQHPDTLAATIRCANIQREHFDCCPDSVVYFRRSDVWEHIGRHPLANTGYSARWLTDQELNP